MSGILFHFKLRQSSLANSQYHVDTTAASELETKHPFHQISIKIGESDGKNYALDLGVDATGANLLAIQGQYHRARRITSSYTGAGTQLKGIETANQYAFNILRLDKSNAIHSP